MSRIRYASRWKPLDRVYTSFLQPLFDYADVAWGEISEGCCKELHRLQNRAAQIILRKNTSNDTFCVLNWLNLASRRKMHKCILVFKSLNNLVPSILRNILQGMWISMIMQLGETTTCTHQGLDVTWAKELLSMLGLFYFNSLSNYVKSATSVNSFKKMLTEYFTL